MEEPSVTLQDAVIENMRDLPLDKQQEVLDFVHFLRHRVAAPRQRRSMKGLWTNVHITNQDIADARRDMWGNFPREDV